MEEPEQKEKQLTAAEMATRERKMARKEEVTREHDKIIGEIEQSDQTCLGEYTFFSYFDAFPVIEVS